MTTAVLKRHIEKLERYNRYINEMLESGTLSFSKEELEIMYSKNMVDLSKKKKELGNRKVVKYAD